MATTGGPLVLLRHGESRFNAAQVFTGLLDADLTPADPADEQALDAVRLDEEEGSLEIRHGGCWASGESAPGVPEGAGCSGGGTG